MSYTAEQPIQYTPDPSKFGALAGGKVWFGVPNGNPASVPGDRIQVYLARQGLADLAIAQPIDIGPGGVWYYSGSPAQIKVLVPYCVQIMNSLGVQKYYAPAAGDEIAKFNALDAEQDAQDIEIAKAIKPVSTFNALSSLAAEIGNQVSLRGHTVTGVGGGLFDVVSSVGLTANIGTIAINGAIAFVRNYSGAFYPTMAGADPEGVADSYAAFNFSCTEFNDVRISAGTYIVEQMLGEYQKPLNIIGEGADVIVQIGSGNSDKKAFRVGAVGGPYGGFTQERAVTKFENITFKTPTGISAPWEYTGIDVQSTYPIVLKDLVFLSLGPDAIKIKACYYGYISGISLVNSGLYLEDVNVIELSGGDIRASDITIDPTAGELLFGNVGKYPVTMLESDLIKFTGTVFEGWGVPCIKLTRCYNTIFNGSWFEANGSNSHIILSQQSQSIEFNSCQLDFAIPYSDCFIKVNNQTPTADENRYWNTFVRISGGYILATSVGFGPAPELVKTQAGEQVTVLIDGVTFRGGSLYASRSVEFDVKSIALNGEFKHNFYSMPNANLFPLYNQWMPKSLNTDWDFALGADFATIAAGVTIATTTTAGEFMTGTKGVKISGIANDGVQKMIYRNTSGVMPEVTIEGQTYYVFIRLKCDKNVTIKTDISGGFADFALTPTTEIPSGVWRDYVFKTQADTTWAQGRFSPPQIEIYITNPVASGSAATLYIDRIDYQIVRGDVLI